MSDLGYYQPQAGVHYGTPNPATDSDPVSRAALQDQVTQQQILRASQPGYVPPSYEGNPGVGPSNQQVGGPSNLPIVGWTCQNSKGPAFEPYTAEGMGHTPNWTSDANAIGAGAFDQNQVVAMGDHNPLNVAPIGDGLLQYEDDLAPDFSRYDVGGAIGGDSEY